MIAKNVNASNFTMDFSLRSNNVDFCCRCEKKHNDTKPIKNNTRTEFSVWAFKSAYVKNQKAGVLRLFTSGIKIINIRE